MAKFDFIEISRTSGRSADINDIGANFEKIEELALPVGATIDGGTWDEDEGEIEIHNAEPLSHGNMIADGGVMSVEDGRIAMSLEEHMVDGRAHGNIILDGGEN